VKEKERTTQNENENKKRDRSDYLKESKKEKQLEKIALINKRKAENRFKQSNGQEVLMDYDVVNRSRSKFDCNFDSFVNRLIKDEVKSSDK